MQADLTTQLQETVRTAHAEKRPLAITGGGSKAFFGREQGGEAFRVAGHRGVIKYEPEELVMTVRGGTPLSEIESLLAGNNQMLGFDPPAFSAHATIGGAVAAGLAGPRRPYAGSIRDHVLGVTMLNGRGEVLRFGGEVVKNVAGFDVSRLMAGSMGTLGIILDVSLRVLPRPATEVTRVFECGQAEAMEKMLVWQRQAFPLGATCFDGQQLYVRLSGEEQVVEAAGNQLGGARFEGAERFWSDLRDQRMHFFRQPGEEENLWRITVPPAVGELKIKGEWLFEWGGALRWVRTRLPSPLIREVATRGKGNATLFRSQDRHGLVFHPLQEGLYTLHKRIKTTFDPEGIFNPGRFYPEF